MAFVVGAIVIGTSLAVASGTAAAIDGGVKSRKAKKAAEQANRDLDQLEKNRQAIVNPYANVSNEFWEWQHKPLKCKLRKLMLH
jgi:hypothetical protein